MMQIYKFDTKPNTVFYGGYKKGHHTIWLNLSVTELSESENQPEHYTSLADRLVLSDNMLTSFLEVVNPAHLALATNEELMAIMVYFKMQDDVQGWRDLRRIQIKGYDSSDKVNGFYLNDYMLWLDKATRVGLVNSISAEKKDNRTVTTLWFDNIMIQMPVDSALKYLDMLELYALDCYNTTARHLADVEKIESVETLQQYDITADYPQFLKFNIND